MKKILFVGSLNSSFIRNDYEELKKYFEVRHCEISPILNPFKIRTYLSMLETLKNVIWCDTVFSWFASWRMIIPTIFAQMLGRKKVVVAGGYDVVNAPEINYGAFARIPDRWTSKFIFRYADIVLPVSKYIQAELLEKLTPKETRLVYNGVNVAKFYPQGDKVDNTVITVSEINWGNLKRKGLEIFVRTASFLPRVNFIVIGEFKDDSIDYLKKIATNNVMFLGFVNDEDLLWWYQKAPVYAQLSYHEGFGLSVAEAMLCECIPIVSNKGALPEVTGTDGVMYGSPYAAAMAIQEALKDDTLKGKVARYRVAFNFSLLDRIERLRMVLR